MGVAAAVGKVRTYPEPEALMPLHPAIVHFPIALAVLLPLVGAVLLAGWWAGWWPRRAWVVAPLLAALLTASAFVAVRTGESEEERVEGAVPEAAIETHEERAESFAWFTLVPLVLAATAAVLPGERVSRGLAGATILAGIASAGLVFAVGHAGGRLVYEYGVPTTDAPAAVSRLAGADNEDDD